MAAEKETQNQAQSAEAREQARRALQAALDRRG